jgi:hypothetical protein
MTRARIWLCAAAIGWVRVFASTDEAHAEGAGSRAPMIHVFGLDSEDADAHADAVTALLRERIQERAGIALGNSTQSLATLTAQLKCKARPDAECTAKIFAQVEGNRFIWGFAARNKNAVNIELHLAQRGKPDVVAKDSVALSQKESRDPVMQRTVEGMLGRLTGTTSGTLRITGGSLACSVTIDGIRKGALDGKGGAIAVEVAPGEHSIDLLAPCTSHPKTIQVSLGGAASIDLAEKPPSARDVGKDEVVTTSPQANPSSNAHAKGPLRPIVGATLIGLGAAAAVVGTVFAVKWSDGQTATKTKHVIYNKGPEPYLDRGEDFATACGNSASLPSRGPNLQDNCKTYSESLTDARNSIILYALGGALIAGGVVVLLTGGGGEEKPKSSATAISGIHNVGVAPIFAAQKNESNGKPELTGAVLFGQF